MLELLLPVLDRLSAVVCESRVASSSSTTTDSDAAVAVGVAAALTRLAWPSLLFGLKRFVARVVALLPDSGFAAPTTLRAGVVADGVDVLGGPTAFSHL